MPGQAEAIYWDADEVSRGLAVVSIALQRAAYRGIRSLLIEPGKRWQKGTNKSFDGKFRDEHLAMNWFYSRTHSKVIIETWRKHYNAVRPHPSSDHKTPLEFMAQWTPKSTTGARVSR
jgi:putative transposase